MKKDPPPERSLKQEPPRTKGLLCSQQPRLFLGATPIVTWPRCTPGGVLQNKSLKPREAFLLLQKPRPSTS